jgi:hypothetical protein
MLKGIFRGAAAGAAGTTALNAATYLDMAIRARPASNTPEQAVEKAAESTGVSIPGSGAERENRLAGLGPLAGLATGTGIGIMFGLVRALRIRPPALIDAVLIGAAAMAATDLSMARMGVSDPRSWSAMDWMSDVLPHLAYGAATHATLAAFEHAARR